MPQLAALYHNDCLHVANELLTLPVVFAGPLKAVTGGIPPDFIPEVGLCRRPAEIYSEQTSESPCRYGKAACLWFKGVIMAVCC